MSLKPKTVVAAWCALAYRGASFVSYYCYYYYYYYYYYYCFFFFFIKVR